MGGGFDHLVCLSLGKNMDALKKFWEGWKKIGQTIGDTVARVLLTVFYFTIMLPFGLATRLFGDRLDMKKWQHSSGSRPNWVARSTSDKQLDDARRQS